MPYLDSMKIGVDIINVAEVKKLITSGNVSSGSEALHSNSSKSSETLNSNGAFLQRAFTAAEIAYCQKKPAGMYQSYAGKLAAKEAFMKAMGTGWSQGLQWRDIEVLNDQNGRPYLLLSAS